MFIDYFLVFIVIRWVQTYADVFSYFYLFIISHDSQDVSPEQEAIGNNWNYCHVVLCLCLPVKLQFSTMSVAHAVLGRDWVSRFKRISRSDGSISPSACLCQMWANSPNEWVWDGTLMIIKRMCGPEKKHNTCSHGYRQQQGTELWWTRRTPVPFCSTLSVLPVSWSQVTNKKQESHGRVINTRLSGFRSACLVKKTQAFCQTPQIRFFLLAVVLWRP